ncbi:related to purine-cytosine permease [Lecanosticta acicola]|uniref:Related to purine-cytosine permease n=1 Tax=Lecanosticta acicola TaxID=111012 RepID=A0AAI8YVT1_9PEZI|nr:related to purine-cytosine permease [Lecanosticta acicola]
MVWDAEKQAHGEPEEAAIASVSMEEDEEDEGRRRRRRRRRRRIPQRPLTAAEKLAATRVNVAPRDGSASDQDPEKGREPGDSDESDEREEQQEEEGSGFFASLRRFERKLDKTLGLESEAIDRKLPQDRQPQPWHAQLNMALLWASGTMNVSCFATGFLGWEFGLSLKQSILCILFASLLGGAVSGFCATLGPATGLRQISIGRYSFGWWPNKIIAALNTIQQIGWSAVGCITGGLAMTAVSGGGVPIASGIIIIACCSLVVSCLGLRAILVYEKYAWLIYFVIFMIIFGETGRYADNTTPTSLKGADLSGNVLSLLAVVYGSSASWATVASDYYVHYAVNVNRTKVFLMTTLGIAIPTSIGMLAGAVVSSAMNNREDWKEAYEDQGLGYLIRDMLYPLGFAKFILILLVLSGINMNILNGYSAAISCQQFSRPFAKIPRFIWTIVCFGVVIALALAGRNHLLAYLQNFLSLLGYWCTSYFVILFTEHYLFKKNNFANYDLEGWNDPKRLPLGLAALAAFCLGVVVWVMGMVETWYVGPIGRQIGSSGGDVSNELTLVVTAIVYVPARYLELKYVGR